MRLTRPGSILGVVVLAAATAMPCRAAADRLREQYRLGKVLHRYVYAGGVNYAELKKDPDLDLYLKAMAEASLDELHSIPSRKSFWINVYNACVLKAIAEKFPVHKVTDVPHMFDAVRWTIGGRKYSLDQVMNNVIRRFHDPTMLFALCNGARSAPHLQNSLYTALDLDQQLDAAVRRFLSDPNNFRVDRINRRVTLSALFRKHQRDFSPGGVGEFLAKYMPKRRDKVFFQTRHPRLDYTSWDWRVNVAGKRPAPRKKAAQERSSSPPPAGKPKKKETRRVWSAKEGRWIEKPGP